jgi:hypothetical protein
MPAEINVRESSKKGKGYRKTGKDEPVNVRYNSVTAPGGGGL